MNTLELANNSKNQQFSTALSFKVSGGQRLKGEVPISGAKNSVLKIMAASLLTSEPVVIQNTPQIKDVFVMAEVLRELGVEVVFSGAELFLQAKEPLNYEAPYHLVKQMRASIIVLGPLLARLKQARVAMPGGCNIGLRKIDLHLKGLELLGAEVNAQEGFIEAQVKQLKGKTIKLAFPSVGATENLVMAAVLAEGTTVIENAAREPEIADLANCLNLMGAKINGAGSNVIVINGVKRLGGVNYKVIPDRIEAGTYLLAGAVTQGDVKVTSVKPEHLYMVLKKLKEIGCWLEVGTDSIRLQVKDKLKAVNISTLPYPGFPTDLQAPFMALLTQADGVSMLTENIFENRFNFVSQLKKMQAQVSLNSHHAFVHGPTKLKGATVTAPDLRAGAALVLAALAAAGESCIRDVHHILRGYERLSEKLVALGANINT